MEILCYKLEALIEFDEDSIEKVLTLCEEAINSITENERAKFKLKSALHELLVNSLEHGYKKSPGKVCIAIKKDEDSVLFEICDEGEGLDLSTIDLNRKIYSLDSPPGRGWGLVIINSLADSMKITPNIPSGTRVFLTISL